MFSVFRKILALILCVGLLYALSVYGVSDVNSGAVYRGKEQPLSHVTTYKGQAQLLSPGALLIKSQDSLLDSSVGNAEQLALQALKQNPSSGRATSLLLNLYDTSGHEKKADEIAELSSRLWPSHTYTRARLADYWLKRQRIDKLLDEWNVLLIRNPAQRKALYPFLTNIIKDKEVSFLMRPFLDYPPTWWDSYFVYLSKELSAAQLREVYNVRAESQDGVSEVERRYYVSSLLKDKNWIAAREEWYLGLSESQKRHDGLVFDGGFETSILNQGFGWQYNKRSRNPRIKTDITYGIKGRKALHVSLNKKDRINFKHVSQRLMLTPGLYKLSMRYRTDTLKTSEGLTWRLRCVEGGNQILGESDNMLGSNPWSTLKVDFNVPSTCKVQLLRLEAASRFKHEWFFDGSLWFDEINITKGLGEG